jgi:hypothetical protein
MVFVFPFFVFSCQETTSSAWYPTGKASVVSIYEQDGVSSRSALVTIKIENTGLSRISTSTVSFSIETDKRSYRTTFVSNVAILPGKAIYDTVTVNYIEAPETTIIAKVTIGEEFYE